MGKKIAFGIICIMVGGGGGYGLIPFVRSEHTSWAAVALLVFAGLILLLGVARLILAWKQNGHYTTQRYFEQKLEGVVSSPMRQDFAYLLVEVVESDDQIGQYILDKIWDRIYGDEATMKRIEGIVDEWIFQPPSGSPPLVPPGILTPRERSSRPELRH